LDLLLVLEVELGLDLLDLSGAEVVEPQRGEGLVERSRRLGVERGERRVGVGCKEGRERRGVGGGGT
jgi:hypothetical protein